MNSYRYFTQMTNRPLQNHLNVSRVYTLPLHDDFSNMPTINSRGVGPSNYRSTLSAALKLSVLLRLELTELVP